LLPATGCGVCGLPTPPETVEPKQPQLQVQGGQVLFAGHAAQAQAQPPPELEPEPEPASAGGLMRMHAPAGHGAVMHSIASWTQAHPLAESAEQEVATV
jgi:hypothetical protein